MTFVISIIQRTSTKANPLVVTKAGFSRLGFLTLWRCNFQTECMCPRMSIWRIRWDHFSVWTRLILLCLYWDCFHLCCIIHPCKEKPRRRHPALRPRTLSSLQAADVYHNVLPVLFSKVRVQQPEYLVILPRLLKIVRFPRSQDPAVRPRRGFS